MTAGAATRTPPRLDLRDSLGIEWPPTMATYEGTDEVHTVIFGHALTGIRAFV